MMSNKEFWEAKEKYEKEMREELIRVQCEGEDRGYISAGYIDYGYSDFWFEIETVDNGRIHRHAFACKNLEELKKGIEWIINKTKFNEVTVYTEERDAFVTFRSQRDIDMLFDYYYAA